MLCAPGRFIQTLYDDGELTEPPFTPDDLLLVGALRARGVAVVPWVWNCSSSNSSGSGDNVSSSCSNSSNQITEGHGSRVHVDAHAPAPCSLAIMRSPWDYCLTHDHMRHFVSWLCDVHASGLPLHNPVPLMLWSLDKRYLSDLEVCAV